jgi:hypothetical protein
LGAAGAPQDLRSQTKKGTYVTTWAKTKFDWQVVSSALQYD